MSASGELGATLLLVGTSARSAGLGVVVIPRGVSTDSGPHPNPFPQGEGSTRSARPDYASSTNEDALEITIEPRDHHRAQRSPSSPEITIQPRSFSHAAARSTPNPNGHGCGLVLRLFSTSC